MVKNGTALLDRVNQYRVLTSSVPFQLFGLRGVDLPFPRGLTYNQPFPRLRRRLATIAVYEEEGLIERAERMGRLLR